jgi:hypothetical protein
MTAKARRREDGREGIRFDHRWTQIDADEGGAGRPGGIRFTRTSEGAKDAKEFLFGHRWGTD